MLRILMCSSARSEKGGMNSVIDQLMDHDWNSGFQFSYLATHISGNTIKKSIYFMISYVKLNILLVIDKFDIIHIHMSYKGSFHRKYYVTKLCKTYNKKVIIHLHGSEFKDFYNSGDGKLKKKIEELFTIADLTIVLGNDWKRFIHSIAPKAKVTVINNAIALPELKIKKQHHPVRLLFLGALIKRKGVADLLSVVKKINDENSGSFELWIAGAGEEEKSLKKFSKENGMDKYVKFCGWIGVNDKPKLLNDTDALVLPSYNEGLPIAILEAMSYGLPIICTDVGSISEAVFEGENGYLFKPGNKDKLEHDLKKLVFNENIWKKMSEKSRKIVEKQFSETGYFKKIEEIYRTI